MSKDGYRNLESRYQTKHRKTKQGQERIGKCWISIIKWVTVVALLITVFVIVAAICWDWCGLGGALYQLMSNSCNCESDLIPVVAIMWTFTTLLFTILMGRVDERTYGIRMIDLLLAIQYVGVVVGSLFAVILLLEPLLLMISIVLKWKITFFAIAFLQVINLIPIACWSVVVYSKQFVLQVVLNQIENVAAGRKNASFPRILLYDMVAGLDYHNEEEMESFMAISGSAKGSEARKTGEKVARTLCYTHNEFNESDLRRVFSDFNGGHFEQQKGILTYLACDRPFETQELCQELFRRAEKDADQDTGKMRKVQLIIWYLFQLNKEWDDDDDMFAQDDLTIRYYECEAYAMEAMENDGVLLSDEKTKNILTRFVNEVAEDEKLKEEQKKNLWKHYFVIMRQIRRAVS